MPVALAAVFILVAFGVALPLLRSTPGPTAGTPSPIASPDWTRPAIAPSAGRIVAADGSSRGWMVVVDSTADGREFWYSPDGATWSRRPQAEREIGAAAQIDQVLATRDGFLVVASGDHDAQLWWSRDGVAWQRSAGPAPDVVRVLSGATGFVFVGTSQAWQSDDLATWSAPYELGGSPVRTGMSGTSRGYLVTVDGAGERPTEVLVSGDGRTWARASVTSDGAVVALGVGTGGLVAIGHSRTGSAPAAWTTVDGAWSVAAGVASYRFAGLVSDGSQMFGASGGRLLRSSNGVEWIEVPLGAAALPASFEPVALAEGTLALEGPGGAGLWLVPPAVLGTPGPVATPAPTASAVPTATPTAANTAFPLATEPYPAWVPPTTGLVSVNLPLLGCTTTWPDAVLTPRPDLAKTVTAMLPPWATPSGYTVYASAWGDHSVIAPGGWRCTAVEGQNGNAGVSLVSPSDSETRIGRGSIPGCVGCQADALCGVLENVYSADFSCDATPIKGEEIVRLSPNVAVVHDPANVKGRAWATDHPYDAWAVITKLPWTDGTTRLTSVETLKCTAASKATCDATLAAFIEYALVTGNGAAAKP